jgi:hypothetical protein
VLADQGGADRCAESRLQLIRRFAAAAVLAKQMESRLVLGQNISIPDHAVLCSTLVRIGARIGINRRLRNVVPDPLEYAREFDDADEVEAREVEERE